MSIGSRSVTNVNLVSWLYKQLFGAVALQLFLEIFLNVSMEFEWFWTDLFDQYIRPSQVLPFRFREDLGFEEVIHTPQSYRTGASIPNIGKCHDKVTLYFWRGCHILCKVYIRCYIDQVVSNKQSFGILRKSQITTDVKNLTISKKLVIIMIIIGDQLW